MTKITWKEEVEYSANVEWESEADNSLNGCKVSRGPQSEVFYHERDLKEHGDSGGWEENPRLYQAVFECICTNRDLEDFEMRDGALIGALTRKGDQLRVAWSDDTNGFWTSLELDEFRIGQQAVEYFDSHDENDGLIIKKEEILEAVEELKKEAKTSSTSWQVRELYGSEESCVELVSTNGDRTLYQGEPWAEWRKIIPKEYREEAEILLEKIIDTPPSTQIKHPDFGLATITVHKEKKSLIVQYDGDPSESVWVTYQEAALRSRDKTYMYWGFWYDVCKYLAYTGVISSFTDPKLAIDGRALSGEDLEEAMTTCHITEAVKKLQEDNKEADRLPLRDYEGCLEDGTIVSFTKHRKSVGVTEYRKTFSKLWYPLEENEMLKEFPFGETCLNRIKSFWESDNKLQLQHPVHGNVSLTRTENGVRYEYSDQTLEDYWFSTAQVEERASRPVLGKFYKKIWQWVRPRYPITVETDDSEVKEQTTFAPGAELTVGPDAQLRREKEQGKNENCS